MTERPEWNISTAFVDRMVENDVLGRQIRHWGYTAFNDCTYRCAVFEKKAAASSYHEAMERFFAERYPAFTDGMKPVLYEKDNALCVALPDALYQRVRDDAVEFQHMARQHKGR